MLPDTRRGHSDKLIRGENFSNEPPKMAVLVYPVYFNTQGRYYVCVRVYSNTLHAPIPINDIQISITPFKPIKAARLLSDGKKLRTSKRRDRISMKIPTLKHYDIVLLEYE